MTRTNQSKRRILSLLLLAALILACLPCGALAEGFSAAVKVKSMKVYADPYGRSKLGALPKKTVVTVEEYSDGVAKISYKGVTGYAKVSDMRAVESFAKKASANTNTRVYEQPNASSASAKVKSGTSMYVLAVSGGVAMVEKGGKVGYMKAAHLDIEGQASLGGVKLPEDVKDKLPDSVVDEIESGTLSQSQMGALKKALEEQAAKEEKKEQSGMTLEQAFSSGKYSNEELIFGFATKVMGYNTAAAAGLLANIRAESSFRPTTNGDGGTSYGICQWHAARKTRLLEWCASKNADSSSLLAQLYFLKYELETFYPAVNRYMKGVDNSAEGAYDAGYYFCFNFESPANKESKSASRGNNAQNTYYPRYAGVAA